MKKFTCPFEKCPKHGVYTNVREFLSDHFNQMHTLVELENIANTLGMLEPIGYESRWEIQQRILDKIGEDTE